MLKPAYYALALAGLACALGGCRGLGYNDQSVNNALTPNVDEKEYVRTWDQGQNGSASQSVTKSQPSAATSDPAYPGYTGPAKTPPPPPSEPARINSQ